LIVTSDLFTFPFAVRDVHSKNSKPSVFVMRKTMPIIDADTNTDDTNTDASPRWNYSTKDSVTSLTVCLGPELFVKSRGLYRSIILSKGHKKKVLATRTGCMYFGSSMNNSQQRCQHRRRQPATAPRRPSFLRSTTLRHKMQRQPAASLKKERSVFPFRPSTQSAFRTMPLKRLIDVMNTII